MHGRGKRAHGLTSHGCSCLQVLVGLDHEEMQQCEQVMSRHARGLSVEA